MGKSNDENNDGLEFQIPQPPLYTPGINPRTEVQIVQPVNGYDIAAPVVIEPPIVVNQAIITNLDNTERKTDDVFDIQTAIGPDLYDEEKSDISTAGSKENIEISGNGIDEIVNNDEAKSEHSFAPSQQIIFCKEIKKLYPKSILIVGYISLFLLLVSFVILIVAFSFTNLDNVFGVAIVTQAVSMVLLITAAILRDLYLFEAKRSKQELSVAELRNISIMVNSTTVLSLILSVMNFVAAGYNFNRHQAILKKQYYPESYRGNYFYSFFIFSGIVHFAETVHSIYRSVTLRDINTWVRKVYGTLRFQKLAYFVPLIITVISLGISLVFFIICSIIVGIGFNPEVGSDAEKYNTNYIQITDSLSIAMLVISIYTSILVIILGFAVKHVNVKLLAGHKIGPYSCFPVIANISFLEALLSLTNCISLSFLGTDKEDKRKVSAISSAITAAFCIIQWAIAFVIVILHYYKDFKWLYSWRMYAIYSIVVMTIQNLSTNELKSDHIAIGSVSILMFLSILYLALEFTTFSRVIIKKEYVFKNTANVINDNNENDSEDTYQRRNKFNRINTLRKCGFFVIVIAAIIEIAAITEFTQRSSDIDIDFFNEKVLSSKSYVNMMYVNIMFIGVGVLANMVAAFFYCNSRRKVKMQLKRKINPDLEHGQKKKVLIDMEY